MATVINNALHGGPSAVTAIEPGTPISGGTVDCTTFTATTSMLCTGNWGSQLTLGIINKSGRIDFCRGVDGLAQTFIGYNSATHATDFNIDHTPLSGVLRVRTATSGGVVGTNLYLNNPSQPSVGVATSPISRFSLPAGLAAVGGAPMNFLSGPLLTTPIAGAEEFLTNNRYYTGTDGVRRTYSARFGTTTVAGLPAGSQGDTAYVTDASAPTWNAAVVGGGTVFIKVLKNATAWVCG